MAQITVGSAETGDDAAIPLASIEDEIRKGLTSHTDRLDAARDNLAFYRKQNIAYLQRRESEEFIDFTRRPKRTSKLTSKVIRKLTEDLYNPGPTRKLENSPEVDAWLQEVYRANRINAVMQMADRMATLNATAAIQAVATGKPEKPVCLYVWGADEFVPFFAAGDHVTPWAVCTIALVKGDGKQHRRLELWSAKEHRVYVTKEVALNATNGGTRAEYRADLSGTPVGSGVNPYGVLPFEFVHDEMPVSDFWEGGCGTALREANAEIDREMSDLAQHVQKYLNPEGFLVNVNPEFRSSRRPGGWQHLRPGKNAEGDAAKEPKAFYAQATLGVEEAWFDIEKYANTTLEDLDVPLVAVREDASTDLSGIAIVAKHMPLLSRTKSRQVPFTSYEENIARLILAVAGNYYNNAEVAGGSGAPALLEAAKNTKLSVVFPAPTFPLPSPERDEADEREVANNYKSEIMAIQERYGLTREQAIERVKQVADDKIEFAALMAKVAPPEEPANPDDDLDQLADDETDTEATTDGAVDDNYFSGMER